jgi:ribosomal protein S4E
MFWIIMKKLISTDSQGHLSLNLEPKSKEYRVLMNEAGQISLDPISNRPDREQWLVVAKPRSISLSQVQFGTSS